MIKFKKIILKKGYAINIRKTSDGNWKMIFLHTINYCITIEFFKGKLYSKERMFAKMINGIKHLKPIYKKFYENNKLKFIKKY